MEKSTFTIRFFISDMTKTTVLNKLHTLKQSQRHAFALLVDPDGVSTQQLEALALQARDSGCGFIFVGGSIIVDNKVRDCVTALQQDPEIPVVLFPGNPNQVVDNADALLLLSLISGRNAELLIGQHVTAAPQIIQSCLEVVPTGYMVIDGGSPTTVSYMSHSFPIPADKPDVALCTAWAGQLLGMQSIYMDAGSGAINPIDVTMIERVASNISIPLIVGGGIRTPEKVEENCKAGAQVIVVGNAIEKDPQLLSQLSAAVQSCNNFCRS